MNQHTNPRPTFGDETEPIRILSFSQLSKECDELDAWYDQMIVAHIRRPPACCPQNRRY